MLKKTFKFLGSLKFAIVLLVVLIAASAVGTWYETQFNADVAQKYIYGAPWFNFWLTALAINLFCAAATRYPFKPHHTGFVITHAGLITLLFGAMVDRLTGIEGYVHLYTNRPPTNIMELHTQVLTIEETGKSEPAKTHFKVTTLWNKRPVDSPDPEVQIDIEDVEPVVSAQEAESAPGGVPALQLTLQGSMMGRNDEAVFLGESVNLGPASVGFATGKAPQPGAHETDAASAELELEFMGHVFKFPDLPRGKKEYALEGFPDWKLQLFGYYPNFKMQDGKPINTGEEPENPGVIFELVGPNVKGSNKPVEAKHPVKDEPQDTTRIAPRHEVFFVFAKDGQVMNRVLHGEPTGAVARLNVKEFQSSIPIEGPNGVAFYLDADNSLTYLIKSRKSGTSTGKVEFEKPVSVSWAPGAQFIVHEMIPSAHRKTVFLPRPELKTKDMENGIQGLKMRVTAKGETKEQWIGQTPTDTKVLQEMVVAGKHLRFDFVNETVTLPFTVQLKKFDAKLQEGSENSFSSFESILSFDRHEDTVWLRKESDLAKQLGQDVLTGAIGASDAATVHFVNRFGEESEIPRDDIVKLDQGTQAISMNEPTNYPRMWYGPYTGLSYKFSQAGHNAPRDMTYSGVQVLRDPGWLFKWVGCIGICTGIFTMFYLRPYFVRTPARPAAKPVKKK